MIGKSISHYSILEKLGRGSMGVVYLAKDTNLDRLVALKFLPSHLSQDEESKARFIHEAKAASALDHANVGTIHAIEETDDGQLFIAMTYYKGETLRDVIDRGPVSENLAVDLITQIASGLAKAHSKGITHRDVKPENVVITNEGVAKVVDFGIAKLASQTLLTKEGSSLGTVAYMSPEQTRGNEVDHRSDIWALGVVLHEMITGRPPFRGDYDQAIIYSILNEDPEPLSRLHPETTEAVRSVANKLLSKDPDRRYQQMDEVIDDLNATRHTIESAPNHAAAVAGTRVGKARYVVSTIAAFIAIVALVAIGWYFSRTSEATTYQSIAVLPFSNLSGDTKSQPFVNGIHEGLLTELSRIADLTVISRTSVMRYAGSDKDIPTIADELGVSAILEGSVQQAGDRVRVTVQLIDGAKDAHLWAENYDRQLSAENIFAIQSELAKGIAARLEAHLTQQGEPVAGTAPTDDLEAYRLYLQGQSEVRKLTSESAVRGIRYFERAIARDTNYALAWVGLADGLALTVAYGYAHPDSALTAAEAAVDKALRIAPGLPEAHASLGLIHSTRYQGPASIRELERAVDLRPGYGQARNWLSWVYLLSGRGTDALEQARRAVELDPLSPEPSGNLSLSFIAVSDFDRGLMESERTLEIQPDYDSAVFSLGLALYHLQRFDESASVLEDLVVPWAGSGPQATIALAKAASGDIPAAEAILKRLSEQGQFFSAGLVYAALGRQNEAFAALEQVKQWDYWPTLAMHHFFPDVLAALQSDRRFDALQARVDRFWGFVPAS